MPKLLLIQPPVQDFYDTDIRLQPIGLYYLKAAVQKFLPEFQVTVRDFHHVWGRKTIPLPRELRYLKPFYQCADSGPFSTFHQYYHFGAPFEEIVREVLEERPDIIGISSLFSPYYREVLFLAARLKQAIGCSILVGGSHVSCAPEMMLNDPQVDFIIRGEGERPLVEFLKAWQQGQGFSEVPNLGYKEGGELFFNPLAPNYPLDELPIPDLPDNDSGRYLVNGKPITFVLTSRGCPLQCTFCSVRLTFGSCYRRRTAEDVLAEIDHRYSQGFRVFDFEDDNLTFDKREIKHLCHLLLERFHGRDIQLLAMNGVSYASLDAETLQLMQQAGFTHLNLALVSCRQEILSAVGRTHQVEQFSEVVKNAADMGFAMVAYLILGLPGDNLQNMIESLATLARLPVLIGVSIFYLTPGTAIAEKFPPMTSEDIFLSRSTAMAIETDGVKRRDLYTLFIAARIINFLKGLEFVGQNQNLDQLLADSTEKNQRTRLGMEILYRLLAERKLYAATKSGLQEVGEFDPELFMRLWEKLDWLITQNGKRITIRDR
ncbi:MAG: B12-binding domain-containing radical SAM protein [Proteobacteria bacterium]|nr:B12-binding domain-containing radical SAM protein [Pseudomonadota bacterium]MBU4294552.1 B12-binding domain-containing radical SAM protein [Pseudomonadota bacterium]MCG2747088.1 B12-binding domain-containing radical SAM protein [Desulfobulbaceae bacterium]